MKVNVLCDIDNDIVDSIKYILINTIGHLQLKPH